jgi:hypothetical protein
MHLAGRICRADDTVQAELPRWHDDAARTVCWISFSLPEPSQSPHLAELLARHGFAPSDPETGPNTILAVRDADGRGEQILVRSGAAVAILLELPRPWPSGWKACPNPPIM